MTTPTPLNRPITSNPRRARSGRQFVGLIPSQPDSPATIERLDVNEISVASYQRHIKQDKLARMVRDWDPAKAGWILVSLRADGSLSVVDGQHRVAALTKVQGTYGKYIDAIVVEDWSLEQEANYFLTQSAEYRSAILPVDIHNAALYAGDERAIEINHIVNAAGFRIGKTTVAIGESGELGPVKAVYAVYDRYGADALRDTLTIIERAWGWHCRPEQSVVSGVALFLGMYPQVDRAAVPNRPSLLPLAQWLNQAKATAKNEGMTMTEGVAYKLRHDYTWKRRTNILPNFGDTLREHRASIRSEANRIRHAKYGSDMSGIARYRSSKGK